MGAYDGLVVWITGGGSGLGAEMARRIASLGGDVAVSGRRADRLADVVAQVEALGRRGVAVPCDVTSDEDVAAAVATVVAKLGRLDVAIANAGFGVAGAIAELSDAEWRRQFDTNVFGAVSVVRHALPHLQVTKGRVALVGSVAGYVFAPTSGAYNASKAAIRAIGETLSAELTGTGVTCTTIHPGFVESEIGRVDNQGVYHPEKRDKRPAQLLWKTEDAARVMVAGIAARKRVLYVTGHGKLLVALSRLSPGLVATLAGRMARSQGKKRRVAENAA